MNIIKKIFHKKPKNDYAKHTNYFRKKTKIFLGLSSLVLLSIGALIAVVVVRDSLAEGGGGDSHLIAGDGGGNVGPCTTGNCYSSQSWIKISWTDSQTKFANPNRIKFSELAESRGLGMRVNLLGSDEEITGCADYHAAYVYVYNIHNSSGFTGSWAGAVQWSNKRMTKYKNLVNKPSHGGVTIESIPKIHINDVVRAAFKSPRNDTGRTWSAGNFGWFCAYDEGTEITNPEAEGCRGTDIYNVSNYGNKTMAHSYVQNRSTSSSGGGFKDKVFAKPGDTIQFCHDYQYGNRFTGRASRDSDNFTPLTNATLISDVSNNGTTGIAQKFRIRAKRDGEYRKKYRFADATAKIGIKGKPASENKEMGKWIKIPKTDKRNQVFQFSGTGSSSPGVSKGDFWFTIRSPAGAATYKCNDLSTRLQKYKNHGYQISGIKSENFLLDSNTCKSGEKTTYNNVGHTISQEIEYEVVKSWVKEGYTTTGRCGCDAHNYVVKKKVYKTWKAYSTKSHEPGKPSATGNRCENDGACSCHWDTPNPDGTIPCDYWNYKYKSPSVTPVSFKTKFKKDTNTKKSEAIAYIPYNFNSTVVNDIVGDVKFLGGLVNFASTYRVEPRKNLIVAPNYNSGEDDEGYYATITPKNSMYRVYELLLPENYDTTKLAGNANSTTDVCAYFSGAARCDKIAEKKGPFNKYGDYDGAAAYEDNVRGLNFNRQIPDDNNYVGYKYCVASSFYPSSSHDSASNTVANNTSGSAFSDNGNGKYNISNLSCVTIAKKPSFQVWGGGFFTRGSVTTSISRKQTGGQYNTDYGTTGTAGIFGSWDEYMIIAGQNVNGMASGAALGYGSGYSFNLSGGISGTSTTLLKISPQTIANNKATSEKKAGNSGVTIAGVGSTMIRRLESRFRDKAKSKDSTSDNKMIIDSKTGAQYFYRNGNLNISEITQYAYTRTGNATCDTTNEQCTSTLTTLPSAYSGAPLSKAATNAYPKADNTLVIYVNGNLTIDRNICYGSAASCNNGQPAKLSSYGDVRTTSISALPQIIIFADNITINSNVDRVEAWLVVRTEKKNDTEPESAYGVLKTCEVNAPNVHQCSKTLVVTGPIYARNLQLKRTGGSNHGGGSSSDTVLNRNLGTNGTYNYVEGGTTKSDYYATDGSIAPAEIFNLRSDAYYWSFNQAQRSTEAVTTYIRELAPRY